MSLVILGACGLSTYWVFRVPIFQSPDEQEHFDYALNIYSMGRPYSIRERLHKWNFDHSSIHVFTQYLCTKVQMTEMAFNYNFKAPPGYGSREYYAELDRLAPPEDSGHADGQKRTVNRLLTIYPYGYYTLLAGWMKLTRLYSSRLSVLFFSGRMFSVVLLACSLVLTYGISREMHLGRKMALLLTVATGFFPMTTFVSAYIQADNLAFLLVMWACYLALRVKRQPECVAALAMLGAALGFLAVTKYHFYFPVMVAVVPMVIAAGPRAKLGAGRRAALLLGPSVALLLVQLWITWGAAGDFMLANPSTAHAGFAEARAHGLGAAALYFLDGIRMAFNNFYLNGPAPLINSTFATFWGTFGWEDAILNIASPEATQTIRDFIGILNVIVFCLALIRIAQVTVRLIRVSGRGKKRLAFRLAVSNPLLNAYFIFTIMMFGLFAVVRGSYSPQGRNWFPFVAAGFLVATRFAPRAVPWPKARRVLSGALLAGLILYGAVGSFYGIKTLKYRYYVPAAAAPNRTTVKLSNDSR